jgi:invasion protein IalB
MPFIASDLQYLKLAYFGGRHIGDKKWRLCSGMSRCLAAAILFAAAVNGLCCQSFDAALAQGSRAQMPGGVVYSGWGGGCEVSKIADVSCMIAQEAKSAAGKRLGLVAYGEDGADRFLSLDVELAAPGEGQSFLVKIDGRPIAQGAVICRPGESFCSSTIVVPRKLLAQLKSGRILAIENRAGNEIELRFPLDGFAQARANLL